MRTTPLPWIDTHCHLDMPPLTGDLPGVLQRSWEAGVRRILVPAVHGPVTDGGFPAWVTKAWGVHPGACEGIAPEAVRSLFDRRTYKPEAIGEVGLDTCAKAPIDHQVRIFRAQAELARMQGLPLLLHVRGAWDQALAILSEEAPGLPWVMHAFCGSWETAQRFLRAGAHLSFSGSLGRTGARKTPRVALAAPADRILIETDAPPSRLQKADPQALEPADLPAIGRFLADLRKAPVEHLAEQIRANTRAVWTSW